MNLRKLSVLALALGAAFSPAMAADQSIDLSSGQASFIGTATLLDGGDDVLTFTGLAAGSYNFVFSISSQFLSGFGGTVNGTPFSVASLGPVNVGASVGVGSAPFTVVINGVTSSSQAAYSGEFSVTAVPEPGTYALLAAGLGVIGLLSRRRRQG